MASLLVSPLLELLIEKVSSSLTKEYGLLQGVNKDMMKLKSRLSAISAVLEDAEMRSANDKPLCDWLRKLKDAAYDADDVLDEFQTEASRQRMKVRDFFSCSHNPAIFCHRIARKIKEVLERFDDIAKERDNFHDLKQGSVSTSLGNERETTSDVIESEVVGRASEKEQIINFLINEQNDKDLPVLAIVGMGGLGKTTLAKLAYNDDRVKSFFDLQRWVYVSAEFDAKDIVRKIIGSEHDNLPLEHMSEKLRNLISEKRLFLVLDDVWNEDSDRWESLRLLLRCSSGKGSKLVTTTRSMTVASVMDSTVEPLCLRGLLIDDCWTLFRERAFGPRREKETPELVNIGMEIVDKCRGLPLAAKALGSLMGSKTGESEWLAVNNSEIWRSNDEENKILPALKLSYYHLPANLKQCFVYCSLFPKGYTFGKQRLISRWIGEGFVSSSNSGILLEDIASRYFNNLLSRSFFQEASKDDFGDIETCKMHDLVHDLACEIAKDELRLVAFHKEIRPVSDCRYLQLSIDSQSPELLDIPCKTLKLRSLALLRDYTSKVNGMNWDVLVRQRRLRLLDLGGFTLQKVPSNIDKLQHLRFLDLSGSEFKRLPKTIGNLYNLSILILSGCYRLVELPSTIVCLQNLYALDLSECSKLVELPNTIGCLQNLRTLDLSGCWRLVELPSTIGCLQNLRTLDLSGCWRLVQLPSGLSNMSNLSHLDLEGCYELRGMPAGMGRLTNLRTLSRFIVSEEEGWHINELKHLNLIRGSLEIRSLEKVRKPAEAKEANLGTKTSMKRLTLQWINWIRIADAAEEEEEEEEAVIENLRPPPNLVVLKIQGYGGSRLPSWIMSSSSSSSLFRNLVGIQFWGMRRCECLPPLGHLPCLKRLRVGQMGGVRRIGEEEFYEEHQKIIETRGGNIVAPVIFPVLEELEFEDMDNLEEWVVVKEAASGAEGGGGDNIIIKRENMFPSLKKLTIWDCPKLASVRPGLPLSVVTLVVSGRIGEEVVSGRSLGGLHKLETLKLHYIKPTVILESSSLREGLQCLTNLTKLYISNIEELTCLPEGMIQLHIPTLRHLYIDGNSKLTSLGRGCGGGGGGGDEGEQQEEMPPLLFTSLNHLSIKFCDELRALPEWMGGLTSLHSLTIVYCPKLEMLPDGLQRLRSLDRLTIHECPIVQRRCERDTGGEDWFKISHIPNLLIPSVPENSNNNNTWARAAATTTNIRGWIPEGLQSCFRR